MTQVLPLAVALGEPTGIGPEIVAKAWEERNTAGLLPFCAMGDMRAIKNVWNGPLQCVDTLSGAVDVFAHALPVLHIDSAGDIRPGHPTLEGARCALNSLEMAVGLTRSGAASAVVTCPISKKWLYQIGFTHPGQTEFVAERCGIAANNAVMMLAGPTLRVVPITTHIPLKDVPDAISPELIMSKVRVTTKALKRDFGIESPRLVMAGLNPHAGECGALGLEEAEIVAPVIAQLRAEGIDITGPHPADALFHARMRAGYDAAICLYHDQALIPLKTLHFDEGVNMTLGLPIIRTSPDHGTAFDIAGKDMAHPGAMIAALKLAERAAQTRALAIDA
ncbi:MAG: 4-hydroxythreonine-4-phosphate dehydrogenase PdxA [Alphaproteobacteria bacterium]|nr:4-hydroxythreonine-4-phosphate dehydrogenase PdxA [Alphaproteobacteria bacterium]MDE2042363.1 4-hydroxythreonine-4-phosphate dehydrogenase PdxA [Alphaproteobacteria bacterium]MDE2340493.1 4-hydroxythreonine-4-phosphate dehydrogenase PdxA [Alphaproteobacteria bacterium]